MVSCVNETIRNMFDGGVLSDAEELGVRIAMVTGGK